MRFTSSKEPLHQALHFVNGVVEKRQTLPILSHVMLDAKENSMGLTATDLEIELTYNFPLNEVAQMGAITIPARKFLDIVKVQSEAANSPLPGAQANMGFLTNQAGIPQSIMRQQIAGALERDPERVRQLFTNWIEEKAS